MRQQICTLKSSKILLNIYENEIKRYCRFSLANICKLLWGNKLEHFYLNNFTENFMTQMQFLILYFFSSTDVIPGNS